MTHLSHRHNHALSSEQHSGVQYVHCVMHKCIMVKAGGNEIHVKYAKSRKFIEIRGKFAVVGGKKNFRK